MDSWFVLLVLCNFIVLGCSSSSLYESSAVLATIKGANGDTIDCVKATEQPAFRHPLLKNAKLRMFPSSPAASHSLSNGKERQSIFKELQRCPPGTIPILRHDFQRANITNYDRKFNLPLNSSKDSTDDWIAIERARESASLYSPHGSYSGSYARFNVWNPKVEQDKEYSLANMVGLAGSYGMDLNTVEAGWHVYPALYGDMKARFFVRWTTDSHRSTGCYNLLCAGFVQVNKDILIGGAITPVSTYNGDQFEIRIKIFKDKTDRNWWIRYGDHLLGYWPWQLFDKFNLQDVATRFRWGGEVLNTRAYKRHTLTEMGNGFKPGDGYKHVSFIANIQVYDVDAKLITPELETYVTKPECYNIALDRDGYYYYGGAGFNTNGCP